MSEFNPEVAYTRLDEKLSGFMRAVNEKLDSIKETLDGSTQRHDKQTDDLEARVAVLEKMQQRLLGIIAFVVVFGGLAVKLLK